MSHGIRVTCASPDSPHLRSVVDELAAPVHDRLADTSGRDVGLVVDRLHTETAGHPLLAAHLLGLVEAAAPC